VAAFGGVATPGALAHEGAPNCTDKLTLANAQWSGGCVAPFQGFPVGVAGYFNADELTPRSPYDAEIYVELWLLFANGQKKPMVVNCSYSDTGVARCVNEYNPLGQPIDTAQPESDIVAISCNADSRAVGPSSAKPKAEIACWSTDGGREDLEEEHWFSNRGFEPFEGPPPASGGVDPFRTLSEAGAQSQIVAVPIDQYATTSMVVSKRLGANYTNLDNNLHDVVARDDYRPDGSAPWCDDFQSGKCPLFYTPLIGNQKMEKVQGLADAEAGRDYTFYCSIHPYMTGTISVVD
jgi:plastocyanin